MTIPRLQTARKLAQVQVLAWVRRGWMVGEGDRVVGIRLPEGEGKGETGRLVVNLTYADIFWKFSEVFHGMYTENFALEFLRNIFLPAVEADMR